jgi:hypothetical protein
MNNIIETLKKLNIETDRINITIFDMLLIMKDICNKKSKIKKSFIECNNTLPEFILLKDTLLDKKYIICNILLNNHYSNPFLDIYFILSNAYLFTENIFDVLYKKREKLNKIPKYMKYCWETILSTNLKKFYNSFLINKWLETLNFTIILENDFYKIHPNNKELYKKYLEIYKIFDKNVCEFKQYILSLNNKITNNNHPGCSNLSIKYYYNFVKLNTGLNINSDRIKSLFKFGLSELKRLSTEQKNIIHKIRPDLKHIEDNKILLDTIKSDSTYKFKSKEEFINSHRILIDKLHKYFIEDKKIKEFKKPNLVFINDPNLSAAYWAYDTFYLNLTNWDKSNTYESLALTLHEAIPGHHTQLNYSIYSENNDINILYSLFGTTNGFCEGWALFIESIYPYYTDVDHVGRLQYELLRTLRIIVDILLNILGIDIKTCLNFMKQYLTLDDKIIETELVRYVSIPGQALCYKIGCEIFRKIQQKHITKHNIILSQNDINDNLIELYKNIIYNKEKSLEALMIEYNLTFEEIFQ